MNKTVLITGASRGIGKEIAREFARNSYNVVLNFNNTDITDLALSLQNLGVKVLPYRANVSNRVEVGHMVEEAIKMFGNIDVLVNNAGIAIPEKLLIDCNDEEIDNVIDVNLKGIINVTKRVLPKMIERRSGKIINISSILGQVGDSCEVIYSSSKAGIIGFTKALSKEVGPFGIQVNSIAPGFIETDMTSVFSIEEKEELKNQISLRKMGSVEDIAKLAYFLASDNYITGEVIGVNGGLLI